MQNIIKGYKDEEISDLLIQVMKEVDYTDNPLTEQEREIIFSNELGSTGVEARTLKRKIEEFYKTSKEEGISFNKTPSPSKDSVV
jgi:hypothetical protein